MPASLSPRILHPSSDTLLPSTGPLPPRFFRSNSRDESGFSSINRWPLALALAYHPLPIPRILQLFFLFLSSLSAQLLFLSFFSFFDFQSRSFLRLSLRKSTEIFFLIGSNIIVSAHVTRKFQVAHSFTRRLKFHRGKRARLARFRFIRRSSKRIRRLISVVDVEKAGKGRRLHETACEIGNEILNRRDA